MAFGSSAVIGATSRLTSILRALVARGTAGGNVPERPSISQASDIKRLLGGGKDIENARLDTVVDNATSESEEGA